MPKKKTAVPSKNEDWAVELRNDPNVTEVLKEITDKKVKGKIDLEKVRLALHAMRLDRLLRRTDGLFRMLICMNALEDDINDPEDPSMRELLRDIGLCLRDGPFETIEIWAEGADSRCHDQKDFWQGTETVEASTKRFLDKLLKR